MFSLTRSLKVGYILCLAAVVLLLSQPQPAEAQRSPVAPMLGLVDGLMSQSLSQAQMMIMLGGVNGMGGMGGMSMMGLGGMMGMSGMGMMGMMGMSGMGMMGMSGMGMMGMTSMSMMGTGIGMTGMMMGIGGMNMMGVGGMNMMGMGGIGSMMGFAGKGFGAFNGKKAL